MKKLIIQKTKIERLLMRTFMSLVMVYIIAILIGCSAAQPKSNYEIYSTPVAGATSYNFFLEKKSVVAYKLIQGTDYLSPDVSVLKVGTATTPSFIISIVNDGSEYTAGAVAVNAGGFYSGMGVIVGIVGVVPPAPVVGLRKK